MQQGLLLSLLLCYCGYKNVVQVPDFRHTLRKFRKLMELSTFILSCIKLV
jgi:hypothetical protein